MSGSTRGWGALALFLALLLLLLQSVSIQGRPDVGRWKGKAAVRVEADDFDLTAEQRRLLFEDEAPTAAPPPPPSPPPPPTPPDSLPSTIPIPSASATPSALLSSSSSPLSTSPPPFPFHCANDLGGVHRLLSALLSPSSMSHSGDWRLALHLSPAQHAALSDLLRHRRDEDVHELLTLGEQLLHSATFTRVSPAGEEWATAATGHSATLLGSLLDGVQRRAAEVVGLLHDQVFAPIGLSSTPAHTGLWLQALLLLLSAVIGSALSSHLHSAPSPSNSVPAPSTHPASSAVSAALPSPTLSRKGRLRAPAEKRPPSFASSLWVGCLLLLLVLFISGYVHHYHTLFIEQRARNRVLQSNPPPGCLDASPPTLYTFLTTLTSTLTRASKDDACWRWEASLHHSAYPNPLVVLSSFLSLTLFSPLSHAGDALGAFTRHFLSHHSVLMQVTMLVFLLLFMLGCVALCMLLGKMCVMRVGMGMGRRAVGSGRGGRVAGRRGDVLIEEADEDEEDEEEEAERVRRLRRLLKGVRRKEEVRELVRLVSHAHDEVDHEEAEARERKEERQRGGRPQPRPRLLKEEEVADGEAKEAGGEEEKVKEEGVVKQEQSHPLGARRLHSPVQLASPTVAQPVPTAKVKEEHPVPVVANTNAES